jgi:two-component system sensor histidine kinase HydH
VELVFQEPLVPVVIEADSGQLQQILVNLILNALDAMPRGGKLNLSIALDRTKHVEIVVKDSGPGISKEIMPRLFEPFVTGKETGSGLGLVVSKRIAEDHGGGISASNPPEGGACFVVRLPIK